MPHQASDSEQLLCEWSSWMYYAWPCHSKDVRDIALVDSSKREGADRSEAFGLVGVAGFQLQTVPGRHAHGHVATLICCRPCPPAGAVHFSGHEFDLPATTGVFSF